jgi:16S rRNA (cytosine967-C5)-methyltransferase
VTDRERALLLLRRIERESSFAAPLLQNETGFVRTLVLGVLRWRSRIDHAIATLANRRIEKLDPVVVELLRLGLYQLMFMDVAPHAAVNETVDLAGHYAKRARGFVNAVLRNATRTKVEPDSVATATAHPQWLIERWTRAYGAERARRIAEADQELSYPDALSEVKPTEDAEPSTLVAGIWKLRGATPDDTWAMDEGSAVIAAIAANAGREVLDLAAAPGSKTLYMRSRGTRVISNDISFARLRPLVARGGEVVVGDGRAAPFRRQFDVVLIDAPCSATGTIRKNPELKWRLRENDIAAFTQLQRELLTAALSLARHAVIYSTCSLEPEENDEVIDAVLATQRDFERADITGITPDGAKSWAENGVLRLTPESGADGFTAFLLTRAKVT